MVTIQKGGILYDEPIRGISISIVATKQHEGIDINVFLGQDSESGKCPVGVPMCQWVMDAMRYHISELFDPSLTVPTLAEDYSGGRSRVMCATCGEEITGEANRDWIGRDDRFGTRWGSHTRMGSGDYVFNGDAYHIECVPSDLVKSLPGYLFPTYVLRRMNAIDQRLSSIEKMYTDEIALIWRCLFALPADMVSKLSTRKLWWRRGLKQETK